MTTGGDDVLAAPLSALGLTIRTYNTLLNNGCSTVGDAMAKTEIEIWQLDRVGPATLTDIKVKLSRRGLALRPGGGPLPNRK
jgi:DNA-directed RNA polymerase alpha subunit